MRLVGVHIPSIFKIKLLLFEFRISILFDHELPRHFLPTLFPIQPSIKYEHSHLINPRIASDQCEKGIFHGPEFIIVDDQAVIVEFVFVHGALVVELDGVFGAEFGYGDNVFGDSLDFYVT